MTTTEDGLRQSQRHMLGAAIAMAAADGTLTHAEKELIDKMCSHAQLDADLRAEVAAMMRSPPAPEELAQWSTSRAERMEVYAVALRTARVDASVSDEERGLLRRIADALELEPEEVERARELSRSKRR